MQPPRPGSKFLGRGSPDAYQLAAMGICWLQLVDFDIVEPANLACQGYFEADLGLRKVDATASLIRQINSQVEVHVEAERFRRSMVSFRQR